MPDPESTPAPYLSSLSIKSTITFPGGTGIKAEAEVRWQGHNESEEGLKGHGGTTCMK